MTIKKRTIKRGPKKIKLHPAVAKHNRKCQKFCNRLQADTDDASIYCAMREIAEEGGLSFYPEDPNPERLAADILAKLNGQVTTLQMNYPDNISFRTYLSFEDRTKTPLYGYHYPVMSVVKTSHTMAVSVILAYVQLSQMVGRFL